MVRTPSPRAPRAPPRLPPRAPARATHHVAGVWASHLAVASQAIFKQTGVHPELAERAASAAAAPPSLPASDRRRPHVFLDFAAGGARRQSTPTAAPPELFRDLVPTSASDFILRATRVPPPPSPDALAYEGAELARIVPGGSVAVGPPLRAAATRKSAGDPRPAEPSLRAPLSHVAPFVASVSRSTGELTITLAACASLDAGHQVIGRVARGEDVVQTLAALETDAEFAPKTRPAPRCVACGEAAGPERGSVPRGGRRDAGREGQGGARAPREGARGDQGGDRGEVGAGERGAGAGIKRAVREGARKVEAGRKKPKAAEEAGAKPKGGMMSALLGDLGEGESSSDDESGSG